MKAQAEAEAEAKKIKDATQLKGVKRDLIQGSKEYQQKFQEQLEALPEFEKEQARKKCKEMADLVYEIETMIKLTEDVFMGLREKLEASFASDENKTGLMVQDPSEYLDCVKLDKDRLRAVMEKDTKHY